MFVSKKQIFCGDLCRQISKAIRYVKGCRSDGRLMSIDVQVAIDTRLAHIMAGGYAETERSLAPSQRQEVWERSEGRCEQCGKIGKEIDHIRGSSSDLRNLQLLCRQCHQDKTQSTFIPAPTELIENVREPIFRRVDFSPPQQPTDSVDWSFRFWAVNAAPTDEDALNAWKNVVAAALDKPNQQGTVYEAARGFPPELKAWSWYDSAGADVESTRANNAIRAGSLAVRANVLWNSGADPERIKSLYEEALSLDPSYVVGFRNYARFLAHVCGDLDRSEEMWLRAIDADSEPKFALAEYAKFLDVFRGDHKRASEVRGQATGRDKFERPR
jgi:5-methylcytosine-specific restriction endonuclease McrA